MIRKAEARWNGDLMSGNGTMKLGSGAFEGAYSFKSRIEDGPGTNPEELLGAAHAGCFTMALSLILGNAGHPPQSLHTTAKVHFGPVDGGFAITLIELSTEGTVPGIDAAAFAEHAETAKKNCPLSKALTGTQITLTAHLNA